MQEIINTLLVSCVPALLTGFGSFYTANKKAKVEIEALKASNSHEIERLMKQHEIDIEALKEQHLLESEKSEQEHRHKIEIMEVEHKNALESKEKEQSNAVLYSVIAELFKDPTRLTGLVDLMNNPIFSNDKKAP